MQVAFNQSFCKSIVEVYAQQWTSYGWSDDDDDELWNI